MSASPAVDPPLCLDDDQKVVVESWRNDLQVVSAGPGAGKTSTLCALAERIYREHRTDVRILVLAYNRNAEKVFGGKLAKLGVKCTHKKELSTSTGCFVLTFDKYGYWRGGRGNYDDDGNDVGDLDGAPESEIDSDAFYDDYEPPGPGSAASGPALVASGPGSAAPEQKAAPAPVADVPMTAAAAAAMAAAVPSVAREQKSAPAVAMTTVAAAAMTAAPAAAPQPMAIIAKTIRPEFADLTTMSNDVRSSDESGGSHRLALETAAAANSKERWDWVIVDEAQDVLPTHAQLIDQLRERTDHFVAAGDPRQEIYSGATWFSKLWSNTPAAKKHVLRYNHRSHPDIVRFLNIYSRMFFPQLHYDQIAARGKDEAKASSQRARIEIMRPVSEKKRTKSAQDFKLAWQKERDRMRVRAGQLAGKSLAEFPPGAGYVVAPVTVKRFNMTTLIDSLRQEMHESHPKTPPTVFNDESDSRVLDEKGYFVGTSYKMKGSEREGVVVVGPDIPYERYGVGPTLLLKLIFVAISRAKDYLRVIESESKCNLTDVFKAYLSQTDSEPTVKARRQPSPELPTKLAVSTDLAVCEAFQPAGLGSYKGLRPVEVFKPDDYRPTDDDFVGLFVEMHLGSALGRDMAQPVVRVMPEAKKSKGKPAYDAPEGIFQTKTGSFVACVSQKHEAEFMREYRRLTANWKEHPEYSTACLDYHLRIGRPWTVSERFVTSRPAETKSCADFIRRWTGSAQLSGPATGTGSTSRVAFSRLARMEITADFRTDDGKMVPCPVGIIVGEIDFSSTEAEAAGSCDEKTVPAVSSAQAAVKREVKKRLVELKFTALTQPAHLRQAAIYAAMFGAAEAVVLNARDGTVHEVASVSRSELNSVARAVLALKSASMVARDDKKLAGAGIKRTRHETRTATYVAMAGSARSLTALAFTAGTDKVLGVFRSTKDDVNGFEKWAGGVTTNYTLVTWGPHRAYAAATHATTRRTHAFDVSTLYGTHDDASTVRGLERAAASAGLLVAAPAGARMSASEAAVMAAALFTLAADVDGVL